MLASGMIALMVAGGVSLLVQVSGSVIACLVVWLILRRLMRGLPRDTSPSRSSRTTQIDPSLAPKLRPDDWT